LNLRITPCPEDYGAYILDDVAIMGTTEYYTDADGHVEFDLVQGVSYILWIGLQTDVRLKFTCPEATEAVLFDYLFPRLVSVEMAEADYALAVGEIISIAASGVYSDGSTQNITIAVTFVSGDEAVATISSPYSMKGESVGSTTVNISTINDDNLPALQDMLERVYFHLPSPSYTIGSARVVAVS